MTSNRTPDESKHPETEDQSGNIRQQAFEALKGGHYDLVQQLIADGNATIEEFVENARIYQAELEIQNEELLASQRTTAKALEHVTALFESAPIAEIVVDRHGLIVEANPAATEMFGLRDPRTHHHFLLRLIDETDRGTILNSLNHLISGERDRCECPQVRLTNANGARLIGDIHSARIPDTDGGEPRVLCALVDRTALVRQQHELERAFNRLEASQQAYHVLAQYSPDWDYWLSPEGEYIHVSPGCRDITGYSASAFMEDPGLMETLMVAEDRERWRHHLTHADRTGQTDPEVLLLRMQHRDGTWRWIEHECRPVHADDGQYLGRRGVNRDVTRAIEAQRRLEDSERRYRALFESAREGLVVLQPEGITAINQAALRMLGYESETAVLGKTPAQISPATQPSGRPSEQEAQLRMSEAESGKSIRFEWTHLKADGSELPLEITLVRVTLEGQPAFYAQWHDRTPETEARTRELLASTVFENTDEAIIITDAEQNILAVNQAFTTISGYSDDEVIGRTPRMLNSGHHGADFFQSIWEAVEDSGYWCGELWNRRKSGELYPTWMTLSRVCDDRGTLTNYVSIFSDVSEAKRSEEALYRLAHSDPLTGLANRTLFRAHLEQSLRRAERDGRRLAVLVLDLDLFKNVNDSLGHSVGDELLKRVANAISSEVRAGDTLARLGGDEFVILMEDLEGPSMAAHLAQGLCVRAAQPFQIAGHALQVSFSVGISLFPDDGQNMDSLLSNADLAMYQAKDQGRNAIRFFEPQMTDRAMERLRLESALRGALDRNELALVYQPQLQLEDQQMTGVEVLLRWLHPDVGAVPPSVFIPIAEEIGMVGELGRWVLSQSCAQLVRWQRDGFEVPRLSVNVSVLQVEREDFVDEVKDVVNQTGIAPASLELEITESLLMRNRDAVIAKLKALREVGITFAVDDFGSGFSSLGYLKQLPINRLKIDKTFVDGVPTDANGSAIARAIIALGRALCLEVTAEGVETQAQADFLLREGCHEVQGYLYARPMPAAEIRQLGLSVPAL